MYDTYGYGTYQLVAYNWDHWINKEISRTTKSEINHVTIRTRYLSYKPRELYVSPRKSDALVPTKTVRRLIGPELWASEPMPFVTSSDRRRVEAMAAWWQNEQPGSVLKCYAHHYLGRHFGWDAPWTCTKLCQRLLASWGHNVTEDFYPSRLVEQFKEIT